MATLSSAREFIGMARPTQAYTWHAPSKPHITVPPIPGNQKSIVLPAYQGHDGDGVTADDLRIITQSNLGHEVFDRSTNWRYEMRRHAQMILPWLYLGPSFAAKDKEMIRREGITMLLVIRDTRTALARLLSGEKVAKELGIEAAAVDVADNQELIAAFPRAVTIINDHLIKIYRTQQERATTSEAAGFEFQSGKVLVFCESGNERSASVVAAYLMFHYGLDIVAAMQYVASQRFCVAFDDEMKHLLLSFQDIVTAKRDVENYRRTLAEGDALTSQTETVVVQGIASNNVRNKRGYHDTDTDMNMDEIEQQMDTERFEGRENWVPFHDDDLTLNDSGIGH